MIINVNDKIDKREEIVKYLSLMALFGFALTTSAQAQMPYMDEVKALGAVAGQGLACGASKYNNFELLARAIMITKAPSDRIQADAVYTYSESKANAYVSKQMDGFYECEAINRRFDRQDIFQATLYRDGTIKMPDGQIITPRKPYDATLVYNKDIDVDASAIYNENGKQDVGEIRIKTEGNPTEVKTIYKPSEGMSEISVPTGAQEVSPAQELAPTARPASREPDLDSSVGHIKSRWKN